MGMFHIKRGDTLPVLEVSIINGDGTPHDLTGSTTYTLRIKLSSGTILSRTMTVVGLPTAGVLRYAWQASDWADGNLVISSGAAPHVMEYEVSAPSGVITFPNGGFDTLVIHADIA